MILLIFTLVAAGLAIWFISRLVLLLIWREQILPKKQAPLSEWPKISVVIPARNEEKNIARCVESIGRQTYPKDKFEVIVVDDHSEDRTPEILKELQTRYSNLKTIPGRPLPEGWLGKSNACAHGAESASGDFIFFLDADTWAEPEMLSATVSFIEEKKIDLLSLNPLQSMVSKSEKSFLPGVFAAIASAMRFHESNTPGKPFAMASGQFMVFRRTAYDAVEGHERVAKIIEEDMEFAKIIKSSGHRLYWAFGDHVMNTRMYTSLPGIWQGFSKNLMTLMSLQTLPQAINCAMRFIGLAWLPTIMLLLNLITGWNDTLAITSLSISAVTQLVLLIMYFSMVRALKIPLIYGFTIPLGFTLHAAMLLQNYRNKKNRKIIWKGRVIQ